MISAVSGTAGVGKTALAVHWAHRVAAHFPDGQLYVNLRGYGPEQPVTAADALAGFLRALGVAGQDIPGGQDERAARYRSLLAGRRVLVLADNAAEVAQVRPLEPASRGCVMVVTSRDSMAGLVARDGARRLDLDLLPHEDAISLLQALIGPRADADPGAVAALAGLCARLPLALRVAAELGIARPDVSLAELAGELADRQARLDLLDAGGDPYTAVRAVFSWSYQHLDPGTARAFRVLGLHPGPDFEPYAAAALTGTTLEQARRLLDLLARAHLIQPTGPGRYGMHDLLRAYARELAADTGTRDERHAALTRLFDHYLHAAATAMDTLFPAETHHRPRIAQPGTSAPPVADPAQARSWLDAQRTALVMMAGRAVEGWPDHVTRLSISLFRYLESGGHYPESVAIHTLACDAAHRAGQPVPEAASLTSLADIEWRLGRFQEATRHLREALVLYRGTREKAGEARALTIAGNVSTRQGHYSEAIDLYQQALARYREIGDDAGESLVLGNLGTVYEQQGRYQQATDLYQRALRLCRKTGDRTGESYALTNLGCVYRRQGSYQQAREHLRQALALFGEIGDRPGKAYALANLGAVDLLQGRYDLAADRQRRALLLFRESGDRSGEALALNGLGEALAATGQPGRARAEFTAALDLAAQIGDQDQQARAHHGLARACQATGDHTQARCHGEQALARYTELGAPEADKVRALLATDGPAW